MSFNKFISICCILIIVGILGIKYKQSQKVIQQRGEIERVYKARVSKTQIDDEILINDEGIEVAIPVTPSIVQFIAPKPYITAESYLVGNLETGEIYLSQNTLKVVSIASVSKLYTALVVEHLFDKSREIKISEKALEAYGETGNLMLEEVFMPFDLLHFLLLVSSNDSAVAFAETYGYDNFINEMNAFAQEIGMENTSFKDPSGLSPQNISNANDLFTLSRYLYKSEKDILDISKTKEKDFATTTDHGSHHLLNINPYFNYPSFLGGKTGRTESAKEAMVSLFDQKIGDTTYPIAVILLRSDLGEREINTEKLLGRFMEEVGGK